MSSGDLELEKHLASLTPSTRKLMEIRKDKGPGMLNEEEIELLRHSAKEIQEVLQKNRDVKPKTGDISRFIGALADKTDNVATLEEIENAIASRWAKQELKKKD
ncbi:MAG: hypothetical protein ACAH17_00685 [Candidatus Paceibacterota bacterium]